MSTKYKATEKEKTFIYSWEIRKSNNNKIIIMYKNQYILTIFSLIGFFYVLFFYVQDSNLERNNISKSYIIIEQKCRNSKGGSSVHIKYNNKIYIVGLSITECLKYPVGSKIKLIYNSEFDYFYKSDGLKRDTRRLLFVIIIFVLSIIPWKKIIDNLIYK